MPSKALCDICGRKLPLNELRQQWDGLMVCPEDWSPRHPQLSVRGRIDSQGVRKIMRPEPADVFAEPTAVTPDSL